MYLTSPQEIKNDLYFNLAVDMIFLVTYHARILIEH